MDNPTDPASHTSATGSALRGGECLPSRWQKQQEVGVGILFMDLIILMQKMFSAKLHHCDSCCLSIIQLFCIFCVHTAIYCPDAPKSGAKEGDKVR